MKANMSNSFDDELSWPSEHESIFGPAGLFPLNFLNPSGLDDSDGGDVSEIIGELFIDESDNGDILLLLTKNDHICLSYIVVKLQKCSDPPEFGQIGHVDVKPEQLGY